MPESPEEFEHGEAKEQDARDDAADRPNCELDGQVVGGLIDEQPDADDEADEPDEGGHTDHNRQSAVRPWSFCPRHTQSLWLGHELQGSSYRLATNATSLKRADPLGCGSLASPPGSQQLATPVVRRFTRRKDFQPNDPRERGALSRLPEGHDLPLPLQPSGRQGRQHRDEHLA